MLVFSGFITTSCTFSFGSHYRASISSNPAVLLSTFVLATVLVLTLLLPASRFTMLWHIASEPFNNDCPTNSVWIRWQASGGRQSPGMSLAFRLKLLALMAAQAVCLVLWERCVVQGPVRDFLKKRFPSKR